LSIDRKKEQLWLPTKSGLIVPAGVASNLTTSSTQTYLHLKDKAKAIKRLYADNNIPLPPGCDLTELVADAQRFSDAWLMNDQATANYQLLFRVSSIDRVANAILPLATVPNRKRYLTDLTSGSLDFMQREPSKAKDILWELDLWSTLNSRGIDTDLHEPDLVVHFEDATVGIACKKLYSDNNVAKVLSEGVHQTESTHKFGLLAINLDDLLAGGQIFKASTQEAMGKIIQQINMDFLVKHKRHFKRYLQPGRVISAIVSTSLLADLSPNKPAFNTASQLTGWAIPGLSPEKQKQLQRFYSQLIEQ